MKNKTQTAIIIPARYASTRFPGKPLVKIAGETMLSRVVRLAREAAMHFEGVSVYVTTDDSKIKDHADHLGVKCLMTAPEVPSGSDRCLAAAKQLPNMPDFILNLQGDAPFTPMDAIKAMLQSFTDNPELEVVTPVHQLSWHDLDRMRESKKDTPFSGTTAMIGPKGQALWFSKNIIPAIRKEEDMRKDDANGYSPVHQHMGLYGYRADVLERFCALPQSTYEELEGLEQLRLLENGINVQTVKIDIPVGQLQSGIDTIEDLTRAEAMLAAQDLMISRSS